MNVLETLNNKQLEAVQQTEGYVRVIAGAGSGKTKLLVSRYAYLVKEYGINPANILCVTFTNKAAAEMRKRIIKIIGPGYATSLICTYHGFCARLIRENPEKLFLTKEFQILDVYQQKTILEEVFQKYELKLDYASFQSILKKVAQKKQDLSYVPRMCSPEKKQILDKIATQDDAIIEDYLQRQKAVYSLDFSDLMSYAIYLLKNDNEVRTKWQDRLNYIQVDEFQDSSALEMDLIDILSEKYQNLMIVGDPDQNIYEWRGSDVRLLVDFDKAHPGTQTIILNQNYRSTPQILQCANTLIEKNRIRLKKDLFTLNPLGAPVCHCHSKSESDEVAWVVKQIKNLKKAQNKSYSDFSILYRSGFLSRVIERKLVEENVPYEIYGGTKFYQRMEILDIVAYLRMIAYGDDLSFKRIVNTPRRKFGRTRVAALEKIREQNEPLLFENDLSSLSLYDILKRNLAHNALKDSGAADFVAFIERMKALRNTIPISELVNKVCVDSGYEQYIRELGDEERLDNLSEFKRIANEFEKGFGEKITLDEFLRQIALMSGEDSDKPCDAVKLMTIHASKGLEFPVVFILGFSEGIFPSLKSIEERKSLGLEEERRLCYVAITRAMERLYLLDNEGPNQNGMNKLPSRFIFEIGEENYVRYGKISEKMQWECSNYIRRLDAEMMATLPQPKADEKQMVEHHIFGKGRILSFNPKQKSYTIQFEKFAQPRSISAEYFATPHTKPALPTPSELETQSTLPVSVSKEIPPVKNEAKEEKYDDFEYLPPKNDDADVEIETIPIQTSENENRRGASVRWENVDEKPVRTPQRSPNTNEHTPNSRKISPELKKQMESYSNHWDDPDFPKTGWICTGVTDLRAPIGICEMCGSQIIRYVHHMFHPKMKLTLGCGCVCAGNMEGNVDRAKQREQEFKNRQKRQESFMKKKWKHSARGHEYLKIKERLIVLFHFKDSGRWNFSIDGEYNKGFFSTREQVVLAVFNRIEKF